LLKPEKTIMGLGFPPRERNLLYRAINKHFRGEDKAWNLEELPAEVQQYLRDNFSPSRKAAA
jgi:hypothetical protein